MFIHQDDYIQTLFVVFTTWKRQLKKEEEKFVFRQVIQEQHGIPL